MNRLILILVLAITLTACMSTVTETSSNTYLIETIEFPHSSKTNGFEYAEMEWMKRAEKTCKDKKVIGQPEYKNSINGTTVDLGKAATEKSWVFAVGEISCD